MLMYFFAGFFLISPCVWPNSGYWSCLFLTLWISLLSWCLHFVWENGRGLTLLSHKNLALIFRGCVFQLRNILEDHCWVLAPDNGCQNTLQKLGQHFTYFEGGIAGTYIVKNNQVKCGSRFHKQSCGKFLLLCVVERHNALPPEECKV
jgi:hypothetical protein